MARPRPLLRETEGVGHTIVVTALAEALLLAGHIEFFDLRQPDDTDATFVRALQAAGVADDALLGSAILAHAALVPGWAGRGDEYADQMRAACTYARRAPASAEFLAWLDAVEAECETISGHTREALRLIDHAESVLTADGEHASPDWFTWFSSGHNRGPGPWSDPPSRPRAAPRQCRLPFLDGRLARPRGPSARRHPPIHHQGVDRRATRARQHRCLTSHHRARLRSMRLQSNRSRCHPRQVAVHTCHAPR